MKKFLALSLIGFMMMSCSISPENYQVEINDAVKFYLAACELFVQYPDDTKADKFYDEMHEEYGTCSETESFKFLLQQKVAEDNKYAKKMYVAYENNPILLSGFTPTEENIWQFEELNSAVHFTFTVTSTSEGDRWEISPNEKDIKRYLWKKLIEEDGLAELMSLGMDIESLAEASINELEVEELGRGDICEDVDVAECISNRIKDRYNGLYSDDEIMSEAFYTLFVSAQQADESEIGWPDWNYWNCTNGLDANLSCVDVELNSTTTAIAHVVLSYPEIDSSKQVDMPMVYEDGNWYVDDIISYEDDGKLSLRQSAESIINNY